MTRRGRAVRATGPGDFRRRELPDKPSTSADPPGSVEEGIGRRRKRLPTAVGNLMGAAGLSKIRWSSRRSKTLRRRSESSWSAQTVRGKRERGRCGRESAPRPGDDGLRRGASGVLGPWPWDQGVRAQAFSRVRRGRPRARESVRTRRAGVERTQRTRKRVTAFALERALGAETPGAAADLACPRGRRGSNPSRERETPRTDRGGRGRPARSGSLRLMSLEGRETPGGAIRSGRTGEDVATRTLRGRRSLWKPSQRLRAKRPAGRRNTSRS
jgi:hypothetical protein